jgi:hypothetical protein
VVKIPDDDEFLLVAKQLEELLESGGMDPATSKKLSKCIEDLRSALKDLWDVAVDEEDDTEHEGHCPSCRGEPIPKITQICPAPPGWKAVFAETDSADPTKMMIDDVVAFGVIQFADGETDTTGITMSEASMVPCEMVKTFIGYLKPGQDPSVLASKVSDFLKDQRK